MSDQEPEYETRPRPYKLRPFTDDMSDREILEETLENQRVITKRTITISNWVSFFGWCAIISILIYLIAAFELLKG